MEPAIALFDLDSVLVYPGGYQTAFYKTIWHILHYTNLEYLLPDNQLYNLFEANAVTSEWDKIPITLAIIFEAVYQSNSQLPIPSTFADALRQIQSSQLNRVHIDFPQVIAAIIHSFKQAETPSLGLYRAIESQQFTAPYSTWISSPFLPDLLQTTRDIHHSYPIRLLQNYVLGSQRFQEVYHLPPEVESESLMLKNDQILISPESLNCLLDYYKNDIIKIAALTFRPSLPPREIQSTENGYSPEAEMALTRLQLNFIPLIGYGRISYLAQYVHTTPDTLIKPSPVQALAGIAAAWTRDEWQALTWAYEIYHKPSQDNRKLLPPHFQLHVFEDSTLGIISSRSAVQILEKIGYRIEMHAWGISSNSEKANSLEAAGVTVFPDVNQAISKLKNFFPEN